jgi:hypothetical protein
VIVMHICGDCHLFWVGYIVVSDISELKVGLCHSMHAVEMSIYCISNTFCCELDFLINSNLESTVLYSSAFQPFQICYLVK